MLGLVLLFVLGAGEFLIDENISYQHAPWYQQDPGVGYGNGNYLVAWGDDRTLGWQIYCARVNEDGEIIDPAGIPVNEPTDLGQNNIHVGFDGTNWLIIWRYQSETYGARVDTSGTVLDYDGFLIAVGYTPGIAFDGTNYLFPYTQYDATTGSDVYASRVTPEGVVLDTTEICTLLMDQGSPGVAFDGTNYLVTWHDERSGYEKEIYGARITTDGVLLDTLGIPIGFPPSPADTIDHWYPRPAFDGTNYFVVWGQRHSGADYSMDIYGTRVTPEGVVVDTPSYIPICTVDNTQTKPQITFSGGYYFVTWEDYRPGSDYRDLWGTRVAPDGTVMTPNGFAISTAYEDQWYVELAGGDSTYFLVWEDERNEYAADIYGARVNFSGSVLDPNGILIAQAAYRQKDPKVAWDGTNYLVVWEDWRNEDADVYGARITPSGENLDTNGIVIYDRVSGTGYSLTPQVAFDGTNYLAVWTERLYGATIVDPFYAVRVGMDGNVIGSPVIISDTVGGGPDKYPDLAFGNSCYLTVWQDTRGSGTEIYGARIGTDGSVLDPEGFLIGEGTGYLYGTAFPSVASDGESFLVVWSRDMGGVAFLDLLGAIVDTSGNISDTFGISHEDGVQAYADIGFDGTNYLVVWSDARTVEYELYGARVTHAGEVLDTNGILISTSYCILPQVTYDDTNYIVVWQEGDSPGNRDIYGAKVDGDGNVLETFPVSTQSGNQFTPAFAHGPGEQTLITWSGFTPTPYNIRRIWGKFYYPEVGVEEPGIRQKVTGISLKVYPNPFTSRTSVQYAIPQETFVCLRVYNISGQLVATLVKETKKPGIYTYTWNGFDKDGRELVPGIYFCRLKAEDFYKTRKMVLVR